MLGSLGLDVTVADDGAQGVALVRTSDFDVVLMDCQMPVMDGYQATAVIRTMPDGRGRLLPIIALTANALQGDEQACLDAGMNAFLAKPYSLATLRATLAKWLPEAENPISAAASAIVDAAPLHVKQNAAAINPKAIEALRQLEHAGSSELVAKLVNLFLAKADKDLAQMAVALVEGQSVVLIRLAHTLKSNADILGAEALAACYREVESSARDGRLAEVGELIAATRIEQQRALAELRALLIVPTEISVGVPVKG